MNTPLNTLLSFALLSALACDRKAGEPGKKPTEAHAHEAKEEAHEGLSLEGVRGLRFVPAPEPRAEGAWFPGEAAGDESASAILSASVKGIVASIPVPPGRAVPPGTVLVTLQSPELVRLKADWIGSRAKLERAELELAREQRLFEAGAGSKRELEAMRSETATARAEEESTRLALEARGFKPADAGSVFHVRAPRAGAVSAYKILVGQGVEAGQELGAFQAAQASLAKLELPMPGPSWTAGAVAQVRTSGGQTWKARVEGTPSTLTADTRRLAYRLRLEGAKLPIPGTPLEVCVPMPRAVILPQAALQQVEGVWGVFVKEGDSARFRPVKRGPELGGDVMVLEGLKPGEQVAVEGAYLIKALHLKRAEPGEEGHGH